ncbi:MAG: choice-of-anchor I family protein [Bacteroidia bacterium]|nr:choice-of-anchor I family protein [Bacteroidia bacterium]
MIQVLRSLLLGACLLGLTLPRLQAQTTGDIAFTGFNADGTDGFAFVTFVDIPANTQIWFTDEEWTGTAFASTTSEGDVVWSNTSLTPAGTVVYLSAVSTTTPAASIGVAALGTNASPNLTASGEGLYAYLGTQRVPTVFLSAIANNAWGGAPGQLTGTGLTSGTTAVSLALDVDVAEYTGSRSNQTTFAAYSSLIHNTSNWITQDGSGNQDADGVPPDVPFNTTAFTVATFDLVPPVPLSADLTSTTSLIVKFNEDLNPVTATNAANYTFLNAPGVTATAAALSGGDSVIVTISSGLVLGVFYDFVVSGVSDIANNVMPAPDTFEVIINNTLPSLVVTEIMYDEPSGADTLDFLEIYNAGTSAVPMGGFQLTNGVSFTFPEYTLAPGATVLLAQNANAAFSFYGLPFFQYTGAISNGGETFDLLNTEGGLIETVTYDDVAPWPLGPPDPNGGGPSIEVINFNLDNNQASNWQISIDALGASNAGIPIFASPGTVNIPPAPSVNWTTARVTVTEGTPTVQVSAAVSFLSGTSVVDIGLATFGTATAGTDFTATPQTFSFSTATNDTLSLTIPITDDLLAENDEYFVLTLQAQANVIVGSTGSLLIYINDNDRLAPAPSSELVLNILASHSNGASGTNSAEIVSFDPVSDRMFIANSVANKLDIVNMANPSAPVAVASIDMTPYGAINSVAVKNGVVAVALGNANTQANGAIVFFDANGTFLKQVTAGALPDMITFTPDGTKVLTANEGEPNTDYTTDPEGSVSIVDISGGIAGLTQANVTTVGFTAFNSQEAALKAAGVRIFGPGATVAQDMEPEYITISDDNTKAWITLQENNAVATLDLTTQTITAILPLGYKDHSVAGAGLDGTNAGTTVNIANYPIKGMYLPDAIASYQIGGQTYLITANEGDARDYAALAEESSIGSGSYVLDPTAFPNGNLLKAAIGPLKTTNKLGDTDGDGDFDVIYAFGGRSFSIWNATAGTLVYDSGDQMELITSQDPVYGAIFNASNTNITKKNRSDDKGPEPEGVAIGVIGNNTYAFVALERIGGVMIYNVTNPTQPRFVQYINNRSVTTATGDRGAEGVLFIPASESPTNKNLLLLANEISSTVTVLEIDAIEVAQYTLQSSPLITTVGSVNIYEGGLSGLDYIPGSDLEFYVNTERGPTVPATNNPLSGGQPVLLFPAPAYAPKIMRVKAEADTLRILESQPLKRPDGTNATGLLNPVGQGNTGDIMWSDNNATVITPDVWGIDADGIRRAPDGTFWVCEEYGVSIWNLDASGKVINRYTPYPASSTNNLPIDSLLKRRRANRGFESLAFTPNGKVYAFLESPMNNPNTTTANASRLIRILELDPATGLVQTFGYELQPAIGGTAGIRTRDWRIGDASAINNFEFLVIENGQRGSFNIKEVYKVNIANATPITSNSFGGLTFEQLNDAITAAANGIQVATKTRYLDLLANGWEAVLDKPEGLTILNPNTLAVVNDNDYGISSPNENGNIVATNKPTKLYVYEIPEAIQPPLNFCRPAVITAAADSVCQGSPVVLSTATVPGATYAWSLDGTQVAVTNGAAFTATLEGAYTVTITGVPACASTSPAYELVPGGTAITLVDDTICRTETIVLDAGPGFATYAWSTGAASQSITLSGSALPINTTTHISVTATTADGCVVRDTAAIYVEVCNSLDDIGIPSLQVYPNPAADQLEVYATDLTGPVTLRLLSPDGREYQRQTVMSHGIFQATLRLETLPAGIFLLELRTEDQTATVRVVHY